MAVLAPPDQLTTVTLLPPGIDVRKEAQRKLDFAIDQLPPDTARWVTPDDNLFLNTRNSLAGVTIQVISRVWNPSGDLIQSDFFVKPASDRSAQSFTQPLYYGYLATTIVYVTGPPFPQRGQTYAALYLGKGSPSTVLLQEGLGAGYLDAQHTITWPYSRFVNAAERPGVMQEIIVANPATGSEWSQTVPTGARWRIQGVRADLAASANAVTRNVGLRLDDGLTLMNAFTSPFNQTASTTFTYSWFPGAPVAVAPNTRLPNTLSVDLWLKAGWRLQSETFNLQGNDAWSTINLMVEEVLEN